MIVFVNKARPKRPRGTPRSRQYSTINALADAMSNSVSASLKRGIARFKDRAEFEGLMGAFLAGEESKILATIPWETLDQDLSRLGTVTAQGVEVGGGAGQKLMPTVVRPNITFDSSNPRVAAFINARTANLVKEIDASSKNAIKRVIARSSQEGLSSRNAAKLVQNVIGLDSGRAEHVMNFQFKLQAAKDEGRFVSTLTPKQRKLLSAEIRLNPGSLSQKQIDKFVSNYADRKLVESSKLIARTESLSSVNHGHMEIWRQATDKGVIPANRARKEWIIDAGTACEICEPIQGQRVKLNETFDSAVGPLDAPPAHPNCNCMMNLVWD